MRILFVCSGNAHRSPLAEALLKKLRPDVQVDSAGLHIAIPVSEQVKRYLGENDARQYLKKTPQSLDEKKLDRYDLIIAMQQRHAAAILHVCPACENKMVVWDIQDPYFMSPEDAEKVYTKIEEKVKDLARSI